MNFTNKISDLIHKRLQGIEDELKTDLSEDYRTHLGIEQAVFRRIKNLFDWEMLSSTEKQTRRLVSLAISRKSGARETFLEGQLRAIRIYDLINSTLPYIKVINLHGTLDALEILCEKELEIIDSADFKGNHIAKEEVETAFNSYFEKVQPHKLNMYKECYEKVEALYNGLNTLL